MQRANFSAQARSIHFPLASFAALGAIAMMVGAAGTAEAAFFDKSFFDGLDRTDITFDLDGSGAAVVSDDLDPLIPGETRAMPANEYANMGVTFDPAVRWVNDGNANFDGALQVISEAMGMSLEDNEISIPSVNVDNFTMNFVGGVDARGVAFSTRAVGFWMINNNDGTSQVPDPTITFRDTLGQVIEIVSFSDSTSIQTVGVADYTFIGLFSQNGIGSVEINKDAAIIDNLIFSSVPAPGAGALGVIAIGALTRRRRR